MAQSDYRNLYVQRPDVRGAFQRPDLVPIMNETISRSQSEETPTATERLSSAATQRFELRVSSKFLKALDHLAETEDLSRADVVRRAVGLYARARMEETQGRLIAFANLKEDNSLEVKELIKL